MNIFVLDTNPELAARFHNDRHVVKMILESCQLMATAHHVIDGESVEVPLRPTHIDHPCAEWVRRGLHNYRWLHNLTVALCDEFEQRYGHPHKYQSDGIVHFLRTPPRNIVKRSHGITLRPLCMPDEYRGNYLRWCSDREAVLAYRRYYYGAKQHLAHWRPPSHPPAWWNEMAMELARQGQKV